MARILDGIARRLLQHRAWVLGALVLCGALFATFIPSLETELGPEGLVASDTDGVSEGQRASERTLVVLVGAEDVLSAEALDLQHRIARWLETRPWAARVEGLTRTALPRLGGTEEEDDELTLEALESGDAPLEEDVTVPESEGEALEALVSAAPERFPMGTITLAENTGGDGIEVTPLVEGDTVEPAEREAIRAAVDRSALVRRRLVSEDRDWAVVAAVLEPGLDETARGDAVAGVETWLAELDRPEGVSTRLGGLPHVRATLVHTLEADQGRLIAFSFLGSLLVLLIGFRTVAGVALPLGAVGLILAIVVGGMALAGEPINLLTNVIPPLLITIGLGDAVHLLGRYREELRVGDGRIPAARRTFRAMASACFLTSLTTAVGFGSLAVSDTEVLQRFGVLAALGVLVAYVVTVAFLPAALPGLRAGRDERAPQRPRRLERGLVLIGTHVLRRPAAIMVGATVVFVLAAFGARDVQVDSTLMDQFDPDSEVAATTRILEEELDGIRTIEVDLEAEPGHFRQPEGVAELDALAAFLREEPGVLRTTSHADWLHEAWALVTADPEARTEPFRSAAQVQALETLVTEDGESPMRRYVSEDGARAHLEVRLVDTGVAGINALADRVAVRARRMPGVEATVGGEAVQASRGLDRVVGDLLSSLGLAVVVIFGMLTLLFRSVRLGLLSIPPNVLPLVLVLAYMAVRGIPLHAATAIVFAVSLGLAVDGTIHMLARFQEETAAGRPVRRAILRTLRGSGRAVVLGSLTLLVGFASLLASGFVPIRLFGELSAIAIGGALLAELVLLPALLLVAAPRPAEPEPHVTPASSWSQPSDRA